MTLFLKLPKYLLVLGFALLVPMIVYANSDSWQREWPDTDFSKHSVSYDEIMSGGPAKDGIPSINKPEFVTVSKIDDIAGTEPVISVSINGDSRAYPVRILMYHEIVNDVVGDVPIAVTYCPLCNASMVYERKVGDKILDFGTTGKLRRSDMVMYDRQTESWWQQFIGEAIVGELLGTELTRLPSRIESFADFHKRSPDGKVLVQSMFYPRNYGTNPYVGYDTAKWPFLFHGQYDEKIPPLAYVVMVGNEAWPLELLRKKKYITKGDLVLTWKKGQNSALDTRTISEGRDVGNVMVQRETTEGMKDVVYSVPFAFAFKTFHPNGIIHIEGQ